MERVEGQFDPVSFVTHVRSAKPVIFATSLGNSFATLVTCPYLQSEISFHGSSFPYRSLVETLIIN